MFREYLSKIIQKNDLSEPEMYHMFSDIFAGNITEAQIGAFMGALATKGETFGELAGAARAMRKNARPVKISVPSLLDTCGTGGDKAGTFNISTTVVFVAAGGGAIIAKHGNRSISSTCGSADLLESLGVRIDADPVFIKKTISEVGIGFLYAPLFHKAMKHAAKARSEIGLRSIFNMLGPLTNPAGADRQLIGVYKPELTEMFARALNLLGSNHAFIVHGHDGLDEVSVCAPTRVTELQNSRIKTYEISPEQFFGERAEPADLAGGTPGENADITRSILKGEKGPKRNVVVLNTAFAFVAAGCAKDFRQGISMAKDSIDNGSAMMKLEELVRLSEKSV